MIILQIIGFFIGCITFAAFLTLVERKVIARIQLRIGPGYHGICGVLQPIADALKLFLKRGSLNGHGALSIFAVFLLFFTSLINLSLIPLSDDLMLINPEYGIIWILVLHFFIVLSEVIIGISSKSKYGIIGGFRAYFQSFGSYIPFVLSLIFISVMTKSFNFSEIVRFQADSSWNIYVFPVFVVFLITSFMITNRCPFDFPEAESELVAGAYTEYGGILFGMIYLSEYLNIIFVSALISLFFLGGWLPLFESSFIPGSFWMFLKVFAMSVVFIVVRAILPRYSQEHMLKMSFVLLCPILILFIALFF